jgi:predicted glutamine amidotransferase
MCRMLGVICNDEDLLSCAIHEVRESLRLRPGEDYSGIGIGTYQNDDPLLKKRPSTKTAEIDYESLLGGVASNVLVVHVGYPSDDAWKDTNTHPFRFRRWLFASTGSFRGLERQREDLLTTLPSFLSRNVQGETGSELAFHLYLNRLFKEGTLNDLAISAVGMGDHVRAFVEEVDSLQHDPRQDPSFALLVTNGQVMGAACRGMTMHYSHREGILECSHSEATGLEQQSHRRFKGIMLAADMSAPGHQWREVASGSLLTISKELELRVEPL